MSQPRSTKESPVNGPPASSKSVPFGWGVGSPARSASMAEAAGCTDAANEGAVTMRLAMSAAQGAGPSAPAGILKLHGSRILGPVFWAATERRSLGMLRPGTSTKALGKRLVPRLSFPCVWRDGPRGAAEGGAAPTRRHNPSERSAATGRGRPNPVRCARAGNALAVHVNGGPLR